MKKNGYTLIEILTAVVIIGLIMAIAIPSALVISKKIKTKAYNTKIEMIERTAMVYGEKMKKEILSSIDGCVFSEDIDGKIGEVTFEKNNYKTGRNYQCVSITVKDLADNKDIEWDYKKQCEESIATDQNNIVCDDTNRDFYDRIVVNPVTNNIINNCNIYLYYQNNRVYAAFDKKTCDIVTTNFENGKEYQALN